MLTTRLLNQALSDRGIVTTGEGDARLVNALCEIIGILHRALEDSGRGGFEIEALVEQELGNKVDV